MPASSTSCRPLADLRLQQPAVFRRRADIGQALHDQHARRPGRPPSRRVRRRGGREIASHHRLRPAVHPDRDVPPRAVPGGANGARRARRAACLPPAPAGSLRRSPALAAPCRCSRAAPPRHQFRPVGGDGPGDAVAESMADDATLAPPIASITAAMSRARSCRVSPSSGPVAAAAAARIRLHHADIRRRAGAGEWIEILGRAARDPAAGPAPAPRPAIRTRSRAGPAAIVADFVVTAQAFSMFQ